MFSEVVSIRTEDVIVSVQSAYLPEQSNPAMDHFMFAYRIRITNESSFTVQLLRREWFITDAVGRKRKVEGDGVIGLQPILAPGQTHEYVSGCDFKTPLGQMRGFYGMVRRDNHAEFKVRIPKFTMATPVALN
ncbi:MAG: Co2+/Mg2+ efflux protein ApaG [Bacteroidetes bacterium]|nr:Co2+/Mg2+ efflux protein ApaG [Bacteroidota bacterium]MBL0015263.1 Co2+/Mg2+ efflux protein ApaG [Bacteroidota bacterium]MBP6638917.1 Co2+/Mg2+ efflux protein ApaG [Bacteroidia bacterium]MBP6721921.1 Co2+/Mg2+ efflux protein ApaG [Bacteroidia bacterium]